MDRTSVSGTDDVGSIPTGPTIFTFQKPLRNQGVFYFRTYMINHVFYTPLNLPIQNRVHSKNPIIHFENA